jgi:hypothetical protein
MLPILRMQSTLRVSPCPLVRYSDLSRSQLLPSTEMATLTPAPANAQNRTQQAAAAQNAPQFRRSILIRDAINGQMQNGSKDLTSDESFHFDQLSAGAFGRP